MEIGSFIELQFPKGREYYAGDNVRRLNTGRAAIYYAYLQTGCDKIWIPVYQCGTVREFLMRHGVNVGYYNIDSEFRPMIDRVGENEAILLVNYFGIFSNDEMKARASRFQNVIIDNAPAFYSKPIAGAYNVYSARKFFGVPDGAYVVSDQPMEALDYPMDFSSDTASFLLERIEYGCGGKVYANREKNEERIDKADVMRMSKLTRTILDGIDYQEPIGIRRSNFEYADSLFGKINEIDTKRFMDADCVPMVYPLMVEDPDLFSRLIKAKHFQGHWWNYILKFPGANDFEKRLSSLMVPITIDQRYNNSHLDYIKKIVYDE
ncbi:MAG: hypothetical protein LIP03_00505 [Bacteroidales bacterium]|nr:hypothetical protein [Bacteroidales bacterium]